MKELAVAITLVATLTATSSDNTRVLRREIVEYHCSHYQQLIEFDDHYEFNPPEVYAEITRTCNALKNN